MNPSLLNYFQTQNNRTQRAFYKHGGKVKSQKANPYPSLAEMIRQQGKGEDTVLAHINPIEALILKGLGGNDTGGTLRTDIINKAKELSQRLIDDVLQSNSGKLDESALIQGFNAINNNLNLNEAEKYQVERFAENIFKNYQFTDGPGYFYSQAHKNSNPEHSSFKRGGQVTPNYHPITNKPYEFFIHEPYLNSLKPLYKENLKLIRPWLAPIRMMDDEEPDFNPNFSIQNLIPLN